MANATRTLVMPDGSEYEFFGRQYYGVCSSIYNLYASVNIGGFTSSSLVAGVRVSVLFTYSNDRSHVCLGLNVSNTGITSIKIADDTNSTPTTGLWVAGQVVDFVYDGTSWVMQRPSMPIVSATCSTAAATAAKVVTVSGFAHVSGSMIVVDFTNGNTANNPTLNVNSAGGYSIVPHNSSGCYSFSAGPHLLRLGISSTASVWQDLTAPPISDSTSLPSSIVYASSAAVASVYSVASAKYTKPSAGIPASDLADGVIPTAVSELTNDSGYLTLADLPIYDGSVS